MLRRAPKVKVVDASTFVAADDISQGGDCDKSGGCEGVSLTCRGASGRRLCSRWMPSFQGRRGSRQHRCLRIPVSCSARRPSSWGRRARATCSCASCRCARTRGRCRPPPLPLARRCAHLGALGNQRRVGAGPTPTDAYRRRHTIRRPRSRATARRVARARARTADRHPCSRETLARSGNVHGGGGVGEAHSTAWPLALCPLRTPDDEQRQRRADHPANQTGIQLRGGTPAQAPSTWPAGLGREAASSVGGAAALPGSRWRARPPLSAS